MAATTDLARAVKFIEDRFADELVGFYTDHHGVEDMLDHLTGDVDSHQQHGRHRRTVPEYFEENCLQYCRKLELAASNHRPRHGRALRHSSAVCLLPFVTCDSSFNSFLCDVFLIFFTAE